MNIDKVKEILEEKGCTLLSKTYKSAEPIEYVCACNNI